MFTEPRDAIRPTAAEPQPIAPPTVGAPASSAPTVRGQVAARSAPGPASARATAAIGGNRTAAVSPVALRPVVRTVARIVVRSVARGAVAALVVHGAASAAIGTGPATERRAVAPRPVAPSRDAAARAGTALTGADRAAIEATIRSQLDAFGRDDAEQAFAYATADIRRQFGSSERFMRMVEEQYEPVYRPAALQFLALARVDGRWVQTVRIVDDEQRVWRAAFTMRRQPDRSWKVGGCQLVQTRALAT